MVTGGNSGIGPATAARLAGLGAHVILSGRRLRQILTEYAQHSNDHRPHQARQQRAPLYERSKAIDLATRIKRRQTVQGLINDYARAA